MDCKLIPYTKRMKGFYVKSKTSMIAKIYEMLIPEFVFTPPKLSKGEELSAFGGFKGSSNSISNKNV